MGRQGDASFVIHDHGSGLVTAGGAISLDSTIPVTELHGAWAGIIYATRI